MEPFEPRRRTVGRLLCRAGMAGASLVATLAFAAGECGPSALGAPCSQGGPATLALGSGFGSGVGNPVNVATGNKYQRETDLALPGVMGLELVRHYNALDRRTGPWGLGWTLSYDTRLYRIGDSLQIVQADGSRLHFARTGQGSLCVGASLDHGALQILGATGGLGDAEHPVLGYVWRWRNGRSLQFDRHGRLVRIETPTGAALRIERGALPGHASHREIVRVTDAFDRALVMQYSADGYVHSVMTPAGRLAYRHAHGALQAVMYPDGHWRGYLYEAEFQGGGAARLTGIVAGSPDGSRRRLNSWIYDAAGRVVTATMGDPHAAQGRLQIRYSAKEQAAQQGQSSRYVTVRADDGETRFDIATQGGRRVVRQIEAKRCDGCESTRATATYDRLGIVSSINGLAIRRDRLGRIVRLGDARPVTLSWRGDSELLSGVSMPSVVPGRQHEIRIDWQAPDERAPLLPIRIAESGWRPGMAALAGAAQAGGLAAPMPITREIALQWVRGVHGFSLQGVEADALIHPHAAARSPGRVSDDDGWPGLSQAVDDFGNVLRWRSDATGVESRHYDARHRLSSRSFADGTQWRYHYDAAGYPVRVDLFTASSVQPDDAISLTWRDGLPSRIANTFEAQERRHDRRRRLVARQVVRAIEPEDGAAPPFRYAERFDRDEAGRVVAHFLPEGGVLHYRWTRDGNLSGIVWQDIAGRRTLLLSAQTAQTGFMHGNGVRLRSAKDAERRAVLAYLDGDVLLWAQAIEYDAAGRIAHERMRHRNRAVQDVAYDYDSQSRLIAASQEGFAWQADGSLAGLRGEKSSVMPPITRDLSGLPESVGARRLSYGAIRRLASVHEDGRLLARYWHNGFGERIARQGREGRVHYLFDAAGLVAEWRSDGDRAGVVRRYVHAHGVPVALIEYSVAQPFLPDGAQAAATKAYGWQGFADGLHVALRAPWQGVAGQLSAARVYAIHTDAAGLPVLMSDARRRIRWQAAYSPFGLTLGEFGDARLALRLPGQWLDEATGWHDNYLRTYDPAAGHYLEPDPLGPATLAEAHMGLPRGVRPVTSAFGYAAQQPRRYADPLGLVLFAFDGTRENLATATNVSHLALLYRNDRDHRAGRAESYYEPGPGNPDRPDLDAAFGASADRIVATQWARLLQHLAAYQTGGAAATIDLVGYSRGAALARHFANQVVDNTRQGRFWTWDVLHGAVTACVELRFMGLFDSVAQFGLLGARNDAFDFSIAPDWKQVAHAVALHERRTLFPLLSTADSTGQLPANVIEQGFIGSHGDVGGGLVQAGADGVDRGDLSDVALSWMLGIARRAGVELSTAREAQRVVGDPALHDMRGARQRASQRINETYGDAPAWPRQDRAVSSAANTPLHSYQGDHPDIGEQARRDTEAFIRRVQGWMASSDQVVGMVDMAAYTDWIQGHDRQ